MRDLPRVSFIVLSYNYESYILKTIESILNQTFSDFEVVVVDDASSDRSCEAVRSFCDPRIRLFINERNLGGAASYNRAVGLCRGEYLVNLDADDWIDPRKTEVQLRAFARDPSLDILGTYVSYVDDSGKSHSQQAKYEAWTNRPRDLNLVDTWIATNFLCRSSTMMRRSVHERIGLDEPTMVRAPDYELWTRALYKGCRFGVLQEPLTFYRLHDGAVTNGDPPTTFLEFCYLMLKNIIPMIERRLNFDCFYRIIDWITSQDQFIALRPEERYRLLGAMLTSPASKNFAAFREMILRNTDDLALASVGQQCLDCLNVANTAPKELKIPGGLEVLDTSSPLCHRLISLWRRDAERLSRITGSLRSLELSKDALVNELRLKEQDLAAKDNTVRALREAKESFLATVATQENELQIFRTSKLQRLRSTILYDRFSTRKVMKIIYLTVALATPKPIRPWFRPAIQRLKHRIDNGLQLRPRITRLRNEEWPKERPLLSVVIPCFNYGRYVEEAVDSVLSQTFQAFEIIVVDGGSTDPATVDVMRSLQKPKTRIYSRQGRHLVGDNRNFGIKQARGKYICCLDADDKLKPTYLEKAVFLLESYNYDIVSTAVQSFGASNVLFEIPAKPSLDEITKWNQISTVAVFSRNMWQRARGYHDWGLGKDYVSEDWDLWIRMMALGARAINIPEALMLYRKHPCETLSTHAEAPSLELQIVQIRKFNRKHLSLRNYRRSAERNALNIKVDEPFANLANSFAKELKKPAILLALPFVITGGADTVFLAMAEYLAAHGFDLSVITTIPTDASFGDNTARYVAITKEIYHLHSFLDEQSRWKDFLFYLIASRGINILLLAGSLYVYDLLPEIKERFPNVKVVDHLFNEFGHVENNRKYAAFIDAHIVVNEVIKSLLKDRFGETENKIHVIMHGVDVEKRFNPETFTTTGAVDTLLPPNKFSVSFIGRFSEEKCPEKFVRIADSLRDEDRLHFVMLGNGPEYPRIQQQIKALGLESRIYTPGNVADVRSYLAASGTVVIPSDIEGIPLTLMESLALGVPVIASGVGGIPSVITNGFNGFICRPSDIDSFVENIRTIAADERLHRAMKMNAREYAVRHLSVEKMNSSYRKLFIELLGIESDLPPENYAIQNEAFSGD